VLYGAYQFFQMPTLWWIGLLLVNLALAGLGWVWLARDLRPRSPSYLVGAGAVIFVVFLTPNVLYVVEGRHLGLADIGLTLALLAVLGWVPGTRQRWLALGLAPLLIVSQGTGWSQVVACRLNRAVEQTVDEHREEMARAERVLLDQHSFAQRIPYTWGDRRHNCLDYYWGVQALEPGGIQWLVQAATVRDKRVFVSFTRPTRQDGAYEISERRDGTGVERIPVEGTWVLDYERVFGSGYDRGNRLAPGESSRGKAPP
jgi:hypothetical protein